MLLSIFTGCAELRLPDELMPRLLNTVSSLDIRFWGLDTDKENAKIKILLPDLKKLRGATEPCLWEKISIKKTGLLPLIYRYRHRWGIAVGSLLFASIIPVSSSVVWSIDISGNKNISDDCIISVLESQGFGVGTRIDGVDFDVLHNRFLMESEGIGWIAVNMNGTHANVEVRETMPGNESSAAQGKYYNLVAAEDGQIERMASVEGKPQVKRFDTVQKGELLVSGVLSREEGGIRLESADGSVLAKVMRTFEVSVPLKSEVKVPTGRKKVKKSVKFFSFNINLFVNSGISYDNYDTIVSKKQIFLFDSVALPVWVTTSTAEEYEVSESVVTKSEAKNEAMAAYHRKLTETLGDAELLSKTAVAEFDGEKVTIKCELYCLADIAAKEEFTVRQTEKADE